MTCPKCKEHDFVFFNEAHEERLQRFDDLSVFLLLTGFALFIVGGVPFFLLRDDTDVAGKFFLVMMIGVVVLLLFFWHLLKPRYGIIHRVKAVCRECGYQFYLEQTDKQTLKTKPGSKKIRP